MKLLIEAPLNGLSLGNVTFNIVRELQKKNVNLGLFPTGDIDLSAYTLTDELKAFIESAINDRFKAAYIRQYSPTIEANVFNFEQTSRSVKDFSLMSKADQLPKFVYEVNLNEKAKDVLQSYVNGTYFLDPIEAYRLTVDLRKKSIEGLPNMEGIGDRIERLWEGTDNIQLGKGKWYEPGHSFRRESYHNPEKGAKENMNDALRKQFKECF